MISVIIPTCDRNEQLAKCLDCLAPGVQTLPAEQYEVIVTDDGSDLTAEQMILERYLWARWVAGPRIGPAANRNNGVQYARGEWLAFTDDDCLPDPNWLKAFAEATTGSAQALEGAIHPLGEPNQGLAECPVNLTGGVFWSANIAVMRSLFQKIGGFDPNYRFFYEDVDLQMRLSPFTKILFVPEARVFHPVRLISLKAAITQIHKRCNASAYHWNKHRKALGFETTFSIIVFHCKYYLGCTMSDLRSQKFKYAFVSFVTGIFGTPLLLAALRNRNIEDR